MSLIITGYREQPKMGPMPKSSTTANTTRSITVGKANQPNASLAISSPRMGPTPPSNYQPRSAPVSLTVGNKTPEAPPNMALNQSPNWDKSRGYAPKSFGVGTEYDKYSKIFQKQIDSGSTLEHAMYLSRTATPEDFMRAFGDRSMWKKWGGGNKRASGTNATRRAAINRIKSRRAEAEARNNPLSIPALNNVMMAVTPWAKVGAWEKNHLQDSLRNIQRNQPGAYKGELNRLQKTYPGFQA